LTALISSPLLLAPGERWHPENGQRLAAVLSHLEASGWLSRLTPLDFAPASVEQVAWLHEAGYVEMLAQVCREGGGMFMPDTLATPESFEAAMAELEQLVDRIERADLPLDESLKLFEKSSFLSKWCMEFLKKAEKRIKLLVPNPEGGFELEDIEDIDK